MTTLESISLANVYGGQQAGETPPAPDPNVNHPGMVNPAGTNDVLGLACRPAPNVGPTAWLCSETGAKWKGPGAAATK